MNKQIKINENSPIDYSIGYSGRVTVGLVNSKTNKLYSQHIYKNAGKMPLFKFIAQCLKGEYNDNQRPKYIGIYDSNDKNLLSGKRVLTNTTIKVWTDSDTNSAKTELKFLVPLVRLTNYEDIAFLRLYSNLDSEALESAEVAVTDSITIPEGYTANQCSLMIK